MAAGILKQAGLDLRRPWRDEPVEREFYLDAIVGSYPMIVPGPFRS